MEIGSRLYDKKDGPVSLVQKTESGKILYCIAFEYRHAIGDWRASTLYLHAEDAGDARVQFFYSEDAATMKHIRVVGIAPAIGFQVHDSHGEELSV